MDALLVQLSGRVAVLADAWLAGGRQDEVLQRLAAVAARRAFLQPPLLA